MLDNSVRPRSRKFWHSGQDAEHGQPLRVPVPGPRPPVTGRPGTMQRCAIATTIVLLGIAIWLLAQVRLNLAERDVALFVHLSFVILAFGAVLVADYFFALWVLGRATFGEAIASASRLHLLIWTGLIGLVLSGTLLKPDLASWTTLLKLGFVAALTLNGLQAIALDRRMSALGGVLPVRLLVWGGLTTAVSQICWWGAVIIGFLNANR